MPIVPNAALERAKERAYSVYMSQVNMMNDLIDHPENLRACGYKTLEQALTALVKHTHKEVDKIFRAYEKNNP